MLLRFPVLGAFAFREKNSRFWRIWEQNSIKLVLLLECSVLEIFNDFLHLGAHFGSHFNDFLWEMGSRKNSCKCVTVINFRGLTPSIHGARHAANAISCSWSLEIFLILLRKIYDFKGFESTRDSFWRSGPLFRRFLRFMWFGGHLWAKKYFIFDFKMWSEIYLFH